MTENKTESVENQDQITESPKIDALLDDFSKAFGLPENAEVSKEASPDAGTPPEPKETETPAESEDDSEETTSGKEFDEAMLDLELKRFDKKMTLREYIANHPEDIKEVLQKKWDYEARKAEFKEYSAQEKAAIEKQKESLESIVLRNIAHEIKMPVKTLQDFENDLRVEDAEEAYDKYLKEISEKAQPFLKSKKIAEEQNNEMIEDFTAEFKDVKVEDIFKEIQPYLSASVAMGYQPFPKDALKVFYQGKNFDKLVEQEVQKARESERKKIYSELKLKGKPDINNLPGNQGKDKIDEATFTADPMVKSFVNSWN